MDDIAEFERRITQALERISQGIERRPAASGAPAPSGVPPEALAELDRLREELDEERMANAQLNERLKVQREKAQAAATAMKAEVARLTEQVDEQALAMQRLVTSTIQMREDLRRMREAAAGGEGASAGLIDKALGAELEALHATSQAETAELADIVATLTRIVEAEEAPANA